MGLIDLFVFRVIDSRTAIAGANIGLILVFLQIKEFELYWGRCLFTTRRVLEKSFFLITLVGVNFEAGNETREKIWSDFGTEQKRRAERKEWFLFVPLFLREREIDV